MKIPEILYNVLLEHLEDLKSHRILLNWIAITLFLLVIFTHQDWKIISVVGGWNSLIFSYYFASKNNEYKTQEADSEPTSNRNPDDIP